MQDFEVKVALEKFNADISRNLYLLDSDTNQESDSSPQETEADSRDSSPQQET